MSLKILQKNKLKLLRNPLIFLLLALCLTFCIAEEATNSTSPQNTEPTKPQEVSVFEKILSIRLKHIDGLARILNETDLTYLAYFYVKDSENSKLGAEFLIKVAEKLDFLAGIIMVDCEDFTPKDIDYCKKDPEAKDGYPKMVVYKPPEYRVNPYTQQPVPHEEIVYDKKEVSEATIYNFLTGHILNKSIKVTSENIESFLANPLYNKVILFTDKTQTPLLYRGVSSFYYDRLLFGEIQKDQTALLKRFKVKTFPTLLLYVTQEDGMELDEPRIIPYSDMIAGRNIVVFVNDYALPEKLYLRAAKASPEELMYKLNVKDLNKDNYLKFFEKFSQKRFIVYLSKGKEGEAKLNSDNNNNAAGNSGNSINDVPEYLKKFIKYTNGFFTFVRFNCEKDGEEFCLSKFKVKSLPALLLINKSVLDENRQPTTDLPKRLEKPLRLSLDFEALNSEIYGEVPGEIKEANPQNFAMLINNANKANRVPIIYFYENDIPLALQLVSTDPVYKKYVEFISFEFPSKEIQKNFQIRKLPATILMIPDTENPGNAKIVSYNEELVFSRLRSFIDQTFNVDRTLTKKPAESSSRKDLDFFSDNKKLKDDCLKSNKKLCIFGFFDGRVNKASQKSLENSVKILEDVLNKNTNKPFAFGWVNATCHEHFSTTFNVNPEQIPTLVIYVPSRDAFTTLFGSYDVENIIGFIDRVIQGKVVFNKVDREMVKLPPIKCEEIKEYNESFEDDEILNEILEEQRLKREEQERERKREEVNREAKKKNKKNKSEL